jgi:hypothetical protein
MTLFENEPKLTNHQYKIKGGKLWTLTQEYYDEPKDTFPLHDVEGCMREAKMWCRNVSASRRKTGRGMQKFLSGWVSRSEATGFVTVDPERSQAELIYEKNVREKIELFSNVIHERTKAELRDNKGFMYAYGTYPEFREWVSKQTFKADKADNPPCPPPPEAKKAVATPDVAILKPDIVQDLPPPEAIVDPANAELVNKFMQEYDLI